MEPNPRKTRSLPLRVFTFHTAKKFDLRLDFLLFHAIIRTRKQDTFPLNKDYIKVTRLYSTSLLGWSDYVPLLLFFVLNKSVTCH